jgi:hypothetical protein
LSLSRDSELVERPPADGLGRPVVASRNA